MLRLRLFRAAAFSVAAALALLAGCANPVPPSGGPRDETPPRIAFSRPEAEATNVSGRIVQIEFDEYVDRASFREALSVTPAPQGRIDFDWSNRSVRITFPEPFRDSTTYLLTIDKALTDLRSVGLAQPITLAFATGDQIDRGRLGGRVVENSRGEGREGLDVYAYAPATADSAQLPAYGPLYRTQTGPDGAFQFEYLREDQRYYVVALEDRNRNWQRDPLEAFAAPPSRALATASGDAADSLSTDAPWIEGNEDAVRPRLTGALPLSNRRVALRFSEPVRLRARSPGRVALTDTTTGQSVAVQSVYRRPGQPQRITLRTAPMRPAGHRVRLVPSDSLPPVVADSSGNAPERPAEADFTATERADTLGTRFLGFQKSGPALPTAGAGDTLLLAPGQTPAVQFNQPPDTAALSALVAVRDTATGDAPPFRLATDDGTTYRLVFAPPLAPGQTVRLRVDGARLTPPADTSYTRFARRLPPSTLGAVSGAVQVARDSATAPAPVVVELYASEGEDQLPLRTARTDSTGTFLFEALPEGVYRFRAFLDRDGDGAWDPGRLSPYRPAEPLAWSRQPLETRPRWETATEDTLRIDALRLPPAD